ncbi:MAG: glycosyltransferase [Nocardioidaceae bacterium]|nr:glycosyltransferase [Nocardioidaceae bacterium]MCL2611873.1 glycosyltransferase [Nocardioidaceae bacterium]
MRRRTYLFALVGSRGDVQPALPVALELRRRGHRVTTAVAPNLVPMARRLGLDPVPVGVDSSALLESELVREELRARDPRRRLRALRQVSTHGWDQLRTGLQEILDQGDPADVIVTGLLGQEVGSALAERHGTTLATLHYCPVRGNRSVSPVPGLGSGVRLALAWRAAEHARWMLTRAEENRQRAAIGVTPAVVDLQRRLDASGVVEIQAYDPLLVPDLAAEWGGPHRPFTGYLALSRGDAAMLGETELEPDLEAWLQAGDPPVYVGFGSMPVRDPDALLDDVERACSALGLRALIAGGWNDFGDTADAAADAVEGRVRVVASVDHAAVFPRCAAVVHHGGAGTTAAGLRAGRPTVIGWYSADQPVWGALVQRAGLGVSRRGRSLTGAGLTSALEAALAPDVRRRAADAAGRMIPPEVAVAAAVDALELAG